MFRNKGLSIIALVGSLHLFADDLSSPAFIQNLEHGPWLAGPLLTASGEITARGYINMEPYLFVNVTTGYYNSHWHAKKTSHFLNLNYQFPLQFGLTNWMDFAINTQFSSNFKKGKSSTVLNDLLMSADFQLYVDPTNRYPSVKCYVQEFFPTGPYQKLKAHRCGTDIGGNGAYITVFGLGISQLIHIYGNHYLTWSFNPLYSISTPVNVRGVNAYRGTHSTRGKIHSVQSGSALFGLQYTLTQHWELSFDLVGYTQTKTRFSGERGITSKGTPAKVGFPSLVQFSFAPAVEYNFNEKFALIVGSWFSFAGRNSERFASGAIALNYYAPINKRKPVKNAQKGAIGFP